MSVSDSPQFACDACGRRFGWRAELAGRKAKCPCGAVLTVPAQPIPREQSFYDLVDEHDKASAPPARAPVAAQPVPDDPAPEVAPAPPLPAALPRAAVAQRQTGVGVVPYRSAPTQRQTVTSVIEGSPAKDLYLPITLILVGTVVQFLQFGLVSKWRLHFSSMAVFVGVRLVVDLVLIFIGLYIAARLLSLGLGAPMQAILKIAAIAMAPGPAGAILSYVIGDTTGMLGWGVSLVLYYSLFVLLFELELQEAMIAVMIIWVVRTWVGYLLVAAILKGWV